MTRQARDLSARQRRVLTYFREAVRETGTPPTVRDVMRKCGLKSPRGAQLQLRALADGGLLVHEPMKKPAYRPPQIPGATVPVMGTVPAGHPADNPEDHLGQVSVPWTAHPAAFAVHVKGDSMQDAQILDGDIAVIEPTSDARDREVVLAQMNGGSTIKRLRKDGPKWWLEPANPEHEDQFPRLDGDRVVGRVVAIVRRIGRVA